ncbi:MAG: methyltransferase domain-containing protein [Neisseriaceae bacterium]|nr:methyltransferase domain-containing protein [Neisseriaceae bacterium]
MHQAFRDWTINSASGLELTNRELAFFDDSMRYLYAHDAVQLDMPIWNILDKMPLKRSMIVGSEGCDVICDMCYLPFASDSMDLVCMPHTLEFGDHPRHILREVHRIIRPEGRLIFTTFNPYSAWFFSSLWGKVLPPRRQCIRLNRLKEWLELLGFEITAGKLMIYTPALRRQNWLNKMQIFHAVGDRWFPQTAVVYGLSAIKRVHLLRPNPSWKIVPEYATAPTFASAKISTKNSLPE